MLPMCSWCFKKFNRAKLKGKKLQLFVKEKSLNAVSRKGNE